LLIVDWVGSQSAISHQQSAISHLQLIVRIAALVILLLVAGGAAAYVYIERKPAPPPVEVVQPVDDDAWIDHLYHANPADVAAATTQVQQLGPRALPLIHKTLQDPTASSERVKAVLKACGILGPTAAPAIDEVAEQLPDPTFTAEAAVALSFMGRKAFDPLRDAAASDDAVVRREALRSIGKLKDRAKLSTSDVVPLLINGATDTDAGVRTVAVTYLGIIHEGGADAIDALIMGLRDPEVDVRRSSATALGSFGDEAVNALPALKKASTDSDPEVAREAGAALIKLLSK
jgi:HEAT repeat protein